jgi:hypothetical protein
VKPVALKWCLYSWSLYYPTEGKGVFDEADLRKEVSVVLCFRTRQSAGWDRTSSESDKSPKTRRGRRINWQCLDKSTPLQRTADRHRPGRMYELDS